MKSYTRIYQKIISAHSKIPYNLFKNKAFLPIQLFLEVTYRCNLRCSMCQFLPLIESNTLKEGSELSSSELIKIINSLPGYSLITITGGEPFIRKDIIKIIKEASKKHSVHVITNGTLLPEDICEELITLGNKNLFSKGIVMIGISLEGPEDIHDGITGRKGSYLKTVTAIKKLVKIRSEKKKKYPLINMATVISKNNFGDILSVIELASILRIDIVSLIVQNYFPHYKRLEGDSISVFNGATERSPIGGTAFLKKITKAIDLAKHLGLELRISPHGVEKIEDLALFYSKDFDYHKFICYAPWSKAVISAKGDIMICPNYIVGNIRSSTLKELWNNEISCKFRSRLKRDKIFNNCRGCCLIERKK